MTFMFCSYEQSPLILRLYGQADVIHPRDSRWQENIALFPEESGSRQIFDLYIDLVQTSCGYAAGAKNYWRQNNPLSLDGKPAIAMNNNQ